MGYCAISVFMAAIIVETSLRGSNPPHHRMIKASEGVRGPRTSGVDSSLSPLGFGWPRRRGARQVVAELILIGVLIHAAHRAQLTQHAVQVRARDSRKLVHPAHDDPLDGPRVDQPRRRSPRSSSALASGSSTTRSGRPTGDGGGQHGADVSGVGVDAHDGVGLELLGLLGQGR